MYFDPFNDVIYSSFLIDLPSFYWLLIEAFSRMNINSMTTIIYLRLSQSTHAVVER